MNEQTDLIQYTKKRSLCRRLLPLLLAMGLLLVGCSGGTEPSEPSSDTGSSTASASSTPAASAPEPEPEPETLEQELLKKRGVAFDQSDYKTFTGAEGVLSLQTVFSDLNPKKAGGNLSSVFLSGGKIYQYRCDATLPGGQNCREVGTLPLAEQPVYLQANDFNGADLEVVYRGGKRYSVKSASNNGPYTATESKYLHPVLTHAWRYNADGKTLTEDVGLRDRAQRIVHVGGSYLLIADGKLEAAAERKIPSDGYYFDDNMDAQANKTFKSYCALALNGFQKTLEENRQAWKAMLDDAYRVTVSFDENDQFVLELQGKTSYWLELRYRPECGVWSDVSLVPTFTDGQANWKPDEGKLTDDYLLSLVTSLELGMTAAPFTFDRPKDLTQQQLWLMFLLLMPKAELEATYDKQDGMYHITQKMMENTLISYLEYFQFDITKNPGYSETLGEIVVPTVSGFGGGMLAKLREKHVDGSTVTFTVDYYAGDDVGFTAPEYAKTYTLTFFYGRYRYESAVEAA